MSRLQRSLLQLLASALLLIVVYIVATPKDVPRSALLESSSFTSSSHKAPVEHLEKGARLQKRLSQKEYRTAQLLLAQLHRGRHQQKKRRAQSRAVSLLQEQLVRSSLAGVPWSSRAIRMQGLAAPEAEGKKSRHGRWYKCGNGLCYAAPSAPLAPQATKHAGGDPLLLHRDKKHHRKKTGWYKCGKGLCWRGAPVPKLPADDDEDGGDDDDEDGGDDEGPVGGEGGGHDDDGPADAGSDDDEGDDADDDDLDLGGCALPDSDDPDYASKMQKIENGEIFCCPSDGQWKPMGADCADPEEAKQPTW
jgi:hypothetical protein